MRRSHEPMHDLRIYLLRSTLLDYHKNFSGYQTTSRRQLLSPLP